MNAPEALPRPDHDALDTSAMSKGELLRYVLASEAATALAQENWPKADRWVQALAAAIEAEDVTGL